MRIALDFDGTVTSDETLWENFVAMAKQRGHDVTIVTARRQHGWANEDVEDFAKRTGIGIIYCDMKQKQDCYGADIWIDDRPDMVLGSEQLKTMYEMLYGL